MTHGTRMTYFLVTLPFVFRLLCRFSSFFPPHSCFIFSYKVIQVRTLYSQRDSSYRTHIRREYVNSSFSYLKSFKFLILPSVCNHLSVKIMTIKELGITTTEKQKHPKKKKKKKPHSKETTHRPPIKGNGCILLFLFIGNESWPSKIETEPFEGAL